MYPAFVIIQTAQPHSLLCRFHHLFDLHDLQDPMITPSEHLSARFVR
jgi:hypothetical protein